MSVRDTIASKLTDAFAPTHLEVIDESDRHRGHAGWREGGETHFRVRLATREFAGKPRVAQHRAIMAALKDELDTRVHALAIEVLPPDGPFDLPRAASGPA
jgi:BolA protein